MTSRRNVDRSSRAVLNARQGTYSWGGGVLDIQRSSGSLRPLTEEMDANGGEWRDSYSAGAISGLAFDGDIWAVPYRAGVVSFFYNKEQFADAGVEASAIETWDDLLGAVQTLKDAGYTPLTCGGADKWPLHFFYSYLILRNGGQEAMQAAKSGDPDDRHRAGSTPRPGGPWCHGGARFA